MILQHDYPAGYHPLPMEYRTHLFLFGQENARFKCILENLDWTPGLDLWTGPLDWTLGLDIGRIGDLNNDRDIRDQNNNEKEIFDESEFLDFDDDVKDPDFIPPKKKNKKSKHSAVNKINYSVTRNSTGKPGCIPLPVSCSLTCDETLTSDSSNFGDNETEFDESDSTDDYTLPSRIMDPEEMFIKQLPQTSHEKSSNPSHSIETLTAIDSVTDDSVRSQETVAIDQDHSQNTLEEQHHLLDVDHEEVIPDLDAENLRNMIEQSTNITKVKNKQLRMKGLKYKGVKRNEDGRKHFSEDRSERILVQSKCSRRCEKKVGGRRCSEINQTSRESIFRFFWRNMDWKQKKVYVMNQVDKCSVKRAKDHRKKVTYRYFLKLNDQRVPVCREMFLSTLGISEKMMYQWVQSSESGVPASVDLEGLPDANGHGQRRRHMHENI